MQGRTRGAFEDILILGTVILIGWGAYTFFFTGDDKNSSSSSMVKSSKPQQIEVNESNIEKSNITHEKSAIEVDKNQDTIQTDVTKNEIIKKVIEKEEKDEAKVVDLKLLQKFLIETKQKIKSSIVVNSQNNEGKVRLSIRVTVLKDGSFEQLVYTSGDKELFKNNYENITSVFPLTIDEKIAGDFPRYLRYSFEFSLKEE